MTMPRRPAVLALPCLLGLLLVSCTARPRNATPGESAAPETPAASTLGSQPQTEIAWTPYDQAFDRARRDHKPVVVVFTATWCGHCRTYQGVLSSPEVIALSQELVMVRVDIDQRPDVNARYQDDGGYVPRTLFFRADGSPIPELRAANRTRYVHFLDTENPTELLSLMRRALAS